MNTVTAQPPLAPHVTINDQHANHAMVETSFHEFFQVFATPLNEADTSNEIPLSMSRSIKDNKSGGSQINKNVGEEASHSFELPNIDILSNKGDNLIDHGTPSSKPVSPIHLNSPTEQKSTLREFEKNSLISNLDAENNFEDNIIVGKSSELVSRKNNLHPEVILSIETSIIGERETGHRQGFMSSNTPLHSKTAHNEITEFFENSILYNSEDVSKEVKNVEPMVSGCDVGVNRDQAQRSPIVVTLHHESKLIEKSDCPLEIRENPEGSEVYLRHDQVTPRDSGRVSEKGLYKDRNYAPPPPLGVDHSGVSPIGVPSSPGSVVRGNQDKYRQESHTVDGFLPHNLMTQQINSLPANTFTDLNTKTDETANSREIGQQNSIPPDLSEKIPFSTEKTLHPQVFSKLEKASNMTPNSSLPETGLAKSDDVKITPKGGHKLGSTTENTSFIGTRNSASIEHLPEPTKVRSSISSRKQETRSFPSVGPSHILSSRRTGDNFSKLGAESVEITQSSTVAPGSAPQVVGKPEAGIYVLGAGALQNWGLNDNPHLPHPRPHKPSPLNGEIYSPSKQTGLDTPFPKSATEQEIAQQTTDLIKKHMFPDRNELLTAPNQTRILAPREVEIPHGDTSRLANFRHNFTQQVLNVSGTLESGQVELRLSPDELGTVRIHLTRHENSIALLLSAERPETLDLFRRNIDSLSSDLRDLGFADVEMKFSQDQQHGQQGADFIFQDMDQPAISDPPSPPDSQLQKSQHTELDIRL